MTQNVTGGYGAYVNYGYESTWGTAVAGSRTFGHGVKITINRKNNMEKIYGVGSRNATAAVALKYEGSASVEFNLSNGSFWRAILGTVTDGGTTPKTHTYTETDALPSMSILTGSELGDTDEVTALLGCKVATWELSCAVGETVKVKLECPYKTETLATSGIGSQVSEGEDIFTFAQGTLSIGGTINYVQSITISGSNDLETIWGVGSRFASASVGKKREYNIKAQVAFSNVTQLLTKFYGASGAPLAGTPAAQATLVLTFTNGLSDTSLRSQVVTLANMYIDEDTLPKDVNEVIKEDVSGFCLSGTSIVYSNNTTTDAGSP